MKGLPWERRLPAGSRYWDRGRLARRPLPLSSRPAVFPSSRLPVLPSSRPPRGATLISALLALTVIAVCAGLLLQTCLMAGMIRNRVTMRTQAFAACQSQMELLRARGFHALPAAGTSSFATGSPRLRGETLVMSDPATQARRVTVTVSWQPGQRLPAGEVTLSTLMTPRGLSP